MFTKPFGIAFFSAMLILCGISCAYSYSVHDHVAFAINLGLTVFDIPILFYMAFANQN